MRSYDVRVRSESDQEVPSHFEGEPAASHTRRHLEKVRDNALVQAPHAFLGNDDPDSVKYPLVLVAHSRHSIDLKAATENVTGTCKHLLQQLVLRVVSLQWVSACLSHRTGYGTSSKLPQSVGMLVPLRSEVLSYEFISHEVEADLVTWSAMVETESYAG